MGGKIKLSPNHMGICFASITTPLSFPDYTTPPIFPPALTEAFKSCSIGYLDTMEILKVMFATHQFENAASLARSLYTFCGALQELSTPLHVQEQPSEPDNARLSFLGLYWLEVIVLLSQKHMKEFYNLGAIPGEDGGHGMAGNGLHVPSMVYSEISENTRVSLKGKHPSGNGDEIDISQKNSLQKQSLEEFSVVLALKDLILCSVLQNSREYPVIIRLIGDVFPSCDIEGLLAHETSVREGMSVKAKQNREAGESARESRAASVMQMIRDENYPSEGMCIHT